MGESYDVISAALLGYAMLSNAQRKAYTDRLNQFMFLSPQQQRRIADDLLRSCKQSANQTARLIAETAAVYGAGNKKTKKSEKD